MKFHYSSILRHNNNHFANSTDYAEGSDELEMTSPARAELEALITREVAKYWEADEVNRRRGQARHTDVHTAVQLILNSSGYNRDLVKRAIGSAGFRIWDEEPHLRYNLIKGIQNPAPIIYVTPEEQDAFMRLRVPDAPGIPYVKCAVNSQCLWSDVHVGQRKLLINELLFMNYHASKSNVVVYIGAAGGSHIPALCELFPGHRFLLYDPAPFSKPLMDYMKKNPSRIVVYNELFPPAIGTKSRVELDRVTKNGEVGFLLISDIRRRDEEHDAPTNADVMADMDLQDEICREMKPRAAHLKCRLPYLNPEANPPEPDIPVKMMKGPIYFQPWCGHKSTEARLIAEPPYTEENTVTISARWYESALYYHNVVSRNSRYVVKALEALDMFLGGIMYDSCFDCTFERYSIWLYLLNHSSKYRSFVEVYLLFKRIIGREDERLLR